QGLATGKNGAATITKFDASKFRTQFACELKNFDPADFLDRNDLRRCDPFTQYALIAADQALADANLEIPKLNPFDIGVIWGSGQGGMFTFEDQVKEYALGDGTPRFNPFFVPKIIANM